MLDLDAAARIAWQVHDLAPSVPGRTTEERLVLLRDFPAGSCDVLAYATAAVLSDAGLGDWWVIKQDDGTNWHVWLEWRTDGGATLFSIDTTAHQFPEMREPFVGYGPTPTAQRFNESISATRFSRTSPNWPGDAGIALLEHVRAHLT